MWIYPITSCMCKIKSERVVLKKISRVKGTPKIIPKVFGTSQKLNCLLSHLIILQSTKQFVVK